MGAGRSLCFASILLSKVRQRLGRKTFERWKVPAKRSGNGKPVPQRQELRQECLCHQLRNVSKGAINLLLRRVQEERGDLCARRGRTKVEKKPKECCRVCRFEGWKVGKVKELKSSGVEEQERFLAALGMTGQRGIDEIHES